jgi:hypothetical protein
MQLTATADRINRLEKQLSAARAQLTRREENLARKKARLDGLKNPAPKAPKAKAIQEPASSES